MSRGPARRFLQSAVAFAVSWLAAAPVGAGLLQPPLPVGTDGAVRDLLVADFDGDFLPDLLVISARIDSPTAPPRFTMSVIRSLGAGRFAPPVSTPLALPAYQVSAADIDGDGKVDLVVPGGGGVSIFWGDGSGRFPETSAVDRGPDPTATPTYSAIADLNADGRPDILLSGGREVVVVLSHPPSPSAAEQRVALEKPRHVAAGPNPGPMRVADMDRDGRPDIVLIDGDPFAPKGAVRVLHGDGTGSFPSQTSVDLAAPLRPVALAVADLTRDGWLDVVTASGNGDTVSVFRNTDGKLARVSDSVDVAGPASVRVADMNGDGIADVVVGAASDSDVAVLLGDGHGVLKSAGTYPAAAGGNEWLVLADVDGEQAQGAFHGLDVISGNRVSSGLAVLAHAPRLKIDAGADFSVSGVGGADVKVTATVLSPHAGVSFQWSEDSRPLGSGATLATRLPVGQHGILVEGTAADGAYGQGQVVVTVTSASTPESLEVLHRKVDGLGAPAQEQTLASVRDDVGKVAGSIASQALLTSALATFVHERLDATISSRASSAELAAAVDTLKSAGLGQASLDALGASLRDATSSVRKDLLRAHIESALARGDVVSFFVMPEAAGGALETVRAIVKDTLAHHPASDRERRRGQNLFASGDAARGRGDFAQAYRRFADAYQALTR